MSCEEKTKKHIVSCNKITKDSGGKKNERSLCSTNQDTK